MMVMPLKDIYGFGTAAPEFLTKIPMRRPPHKMPGKQVPGFSYNANVVGAINPPKLVKPNYKRGTYKSPKAGEFSLRTHVVGAKSPLPIPVMKANKRRFKTIPGGRGESVYEAMHWEL